MLPNYNQEPRDTPPTNTSLRLRDYKWGVLIEEQHHGWVGSTGRLHITAAGRALYGREWARYRELYPMSRRLSRH